MNEFLNQFGNRIQSFYQAQEQEKQLLLTDIEEDYRPSMA